MIGSSELLVILIIALLLFGPKKLPELMRALGRATAEYHRAMRDFEKEVNKGKKDLMNEVSKEVKKDGEVDLTKIARKFGIDPENKSNQALLKEIAAEARKRAKVVK